MYEEDNDESVSRRHFLKMVGVTAVAATAVGAGAAVLTKQSPTTTLTSPLTAPLAAPVTQTAVRTTELNTSELLAQLASAQAENMQLRTALDAAQSRLSAQVETDTAVEDPLKIELAAANEQVGLLAGLVALYEQLEQVDMSAVFEEGVVAVSETITELIEQTPALSTGIEAGQVALDDLEATHSFAAKRPCLAG